jgi:putative salt-induced outer membrane protein YdiY
MLFSEDYLVFGYERMLQENQSVSLNVGRFAMDKFGGNVSEELELKKNSKDKGLNLSLDYRFYLGSVNRYNGPRGVYIGPYYSYNSFSRENTWTLNTDSFQGSVLTDLSFNINTLGIQLGYQFIFWDRMALDLILIGPGVGFYGAKVKLDTDLSAEDEALFFDKLNEYLADKIPGYDKVIGEGELSKNGSFDVTSLGFRYMIHLGYKF